MTNSTGPEAEELQAEILGLIAEHDAEPAIVLVALASALGRYAAEHLTRRQQGRLLADVEDIIEGELRNA